jgi:molecular chaperone GrpE (heat shock protein)
MADETLELAENTGTADNTGTAGKADTPDTPEPADTVDPVLAELTLLRQQQGFLNEVLDRLHRENEVLRRGETQKMLDPVVRDLIKLADDWSARGEALGGEPGGLCREVAEDAGLILARFGAEVFAPEPGTPFDRRAHRAVGTADTEDPSLDGTVAAARKPGYRVGERVVRFAEVTVHRVVTGAPATG